MAYGGEFFNLLEEEQMLLIENDITKIIREPSNTITLKEAVIRIEDSKLED